jgi:phospholipid/cholesterol/gamma-HCH transport system permease protein
MSSIIKALNGHITAIGRYSILTFQALIAPLKSSVDGKEIMRQIVDIGVKSVPIVLITGMFTGMVLAMQTAYGLQRFGVKNYVGHITGLSFVRELGPVLTAIVVCGRSGAGIAAEIASMVASEQVDAMQALGANPIAKLVTPRLIAAIVATPILVIFANAIGMYGGLLIGVYELGLSAHLYYRSILYAIVLKDVIDGVIKGVLFGFLIVSVACYKGLNTEGGTEGVGRSTTSAVVAGCVVIIMADYFITKILILFG